MPNIVLIPHDPVLAAATPHVRISSLESLRGTRDCTIVFIDWLLDDGSGLELCRRLRADPSTRHMRLVIVLDEDDRDLRRRALLAGADDYVIGPLSPKLIIDRLGAASPECPQTPGRVQQATIELDRAAFQIRAAGRLVALAPNEFQLLGYMIENSDRLLTRSELIRALKKDEQDIDERTVDVWIGRIRRALKVAGAQSPIRTVRSLGYVYDFLN